jgi:uncharacterized protein YjiS (DUF1127 family)
MMTRPSHAGVTWSLKHALETGFVNMVQWLIPFMRSRRLQRRAPLASVSHLEQQHFGSLDDQLLNDIGLQRSDIRAAEYGILPGDQALHQSDAPPAPEDDHART